MAFVPEQSDFVGKIINSFFDSEIMSSNYHNNINFTKNNLTTLKTKNKKERNLEEEYRRSLDRKRKILCVNVPLPPQVYDDPRAMMEAVLENQSDSSTITPQMLQYQVAKQLEMLSNPHIPPSNKFSPKKKQHILEYPKPAIPQNFEHLYIGKNDTLVPWDFYVQIPWYSYQLSTCYLMEFIFERKELATHTIYGDNCLDPLMVEDIINHVSDRCNVSEEYVVFVIAKMCSDFAKLNKKGLLFPRSNPFRA